MHRLQVLFGQVQDEAALPTPPMSASRPGAQAYLPATGGVQHCSRTEMHQKTHRHADVDHDQGERASNLVKGLYFEHLVVVVALYVTNVHKVFISSQSIPS